VQADIFSAGVLMAQMFTGEMLRKRGELRLPRAPHDCPQVRAAKPPQLMAPAGRAGPQGRQGLGRPRSHKLQQL